MQPNFLSPTYDFTPKKIPQYEDTTKHFIESVLDLKLTSITVSKASVIPADHQKGPDKLVIFDIACVGNQGGKYGIGVQRANQGGIPEGASYYGARLYSSQLAPGEQFPKLKK